MGENVGPESFKRGNFVDGPLDQIAIDQRLARTRVVVAFEQDDRSAVFLDSPDMTLLTKATGSCREAGRAGVNP